MKLVHGFYIMYTLPGVMVHFAALHKKQQQLDPEGNCDWTFEEIASQVTHNERLHPCN